MHEVGVLEAKTRLSELLDAVETGAEDILITRRGRPVARLTRAEPRGRASRRSSSAELVERFRRLRERIAAESPDLNDLTWDDLKEAARR